METDNSTDQISSQLQRCSGKLEQATPLTHNSIEPFLRPRKTNIWFNFNQQTFLSFHINNFQPPSLCNAAIENRQESLNHLYLTSVPSLIYISLKQFPIQLTTVNYLLDAGYRVCNPPDFCYFSAKNWSGHRNSTAGNSISTRKH